MERKEAKALVIVFNMLTAQNVAAIVLSPEKPKQKGAELEYKVGVEKVRAEFEVYDNPAELAERLQKELAK